MDFFQKFQISVMIIIFFSIVLLFLGMTYANTEKTNTQLQDLNSSLNVVRGWQYVQLFEFQQDHNVQVQGSLANLIMQSALINKFFDENDQFVQSWKTQCRWVQQDVNFAYYACKVGGE